MTYEFRFEPWFMPHEAAYEREVRFSALGSMGWQIVAVIGETVLMQRATP
jgi:hypothetical protein